MGAYSASKAAVEALGNTLRIELRPSGARVGVAYFAEIDTDMTSRGFDTEAAGRLMSGLERFNNVAPAARRDRRAREGDRKRSRRVVAPSWAAPLLPLRMLAQPFVDRFTQRKLPPRSRSPAQKTRS